MFKIYNFLILKIHILYIFQPKEAKHLKSKSRNQENPAEKMVRNQSLSFSCSPIFFFSSLIA